MMKFTPAMRVIANDIGDGFDLTGDQVLAIIEAFESASGRQAIPRPEVLTTEHAAFVEKAVSSYNMLFDLYKEATVLIQNIREHGSHDNWKATARALDKIGEGS